MSQKILYNDARAIWRYNNDATDAKGNHDQIITGSTFDEAIKRYGSHSVKDDGLNDVRTVANHADFNQNVFSLVVPVYIASKEVWNTLISKVNTTADTGWLAGINFLNQFAFQAGAGRTWPTYNVIFDISGESLGWHLMGSIHTLTTHQILWDDKLIQTVAGGAITHNTQDVLFGKVDGIFAGGQSDETPYFVRALTIGDVLDGQVAEGEWAELYANFLAGIELVSAGISILRRRMEGY